MSGVSDLQSPSTRSIPVDHPSTGPSIDGELLYLTMLEQPLEGLFAHDQTPVKIITQACHRRYATSEFSFLYTIADDNLKLIMNACRNQLSAHFGRALDYDSGVGNLCPYCYGITCESGEEVPQRKPRIFVMEAKQLERVRKSFFKGMDEEQDLNLFLSWITLKNNVLSTEVGDKGPWKRRPVGDWWEQVKEERRPGKLQSDVTRLAENIPKFRFISLPCAAAWKRWQTILEMAFLSKYKTSLVWEIYLSVPNERQ